MSHFPHRNMKSHLRKVKKDTFSDVRHKTVEKNLLRSGNVNASPRQRGRVRVEKGNCESTLCNITTYDSCCISVSARRDASRPLLYIPHKASISFCQILNLEGERRGWMPAEASPPAAARVSRRIGAANK